MSAFGFLGSLFSGITGMVNARRTAQLEMLNQQGQQRRHDQNLALQEQTLAYQKNLQQQIFQREDSSMQRKVNDMKAAGLNPILAAGGGARAGEAIKVTPPQGQFAKRDTGSQIMKQQLATQLAGQMAEISKTVAETKLIEAEKEKTQKDTVRTDQLTRQEKEAHVYFIREQSANTEYLERTLNMRVSEQAIKNEGERIRNLIGKLDEQLKGFDKGIQEDYYNYVKSLNPGENPLVTELKTKMAVLDVYAWNAQYFMGKELPINLQGSLPSVWSLGIPTLDLWQQGLELIAPPLNKAVEGAGNWIDKLRANTQRYFRTKPKQGLRPPSGGAH